MDDLNQRIVGLEIRSAHQEQVIEELNLVVIECDRRIARLEREVQRYREMLKSLAPSLPESPDE
jgi:uncharacterized coiled-coil protein SlyX